jgi:hypothetical protein
VRNPEDVGFAAQPRRMFIGFDSSTVGIPSERERDRTLARLPD